MDERLNYASPDTPHNSPSAHRRTPGQWLRLLFIWGLGLISWTIYLIVIGYLVLKLL